MRLTPRLADRYIKHGTPVTIRLPRYREEGKFVIIARDRWTITTSEGYKFQRSDCEIIEDWTWC